MSNEADELKKQLASLERRVFEIERELDIQTEYRVEESTAQMPLANELASSQEKVKEQSNIEENLGFQWFSRIGILALVIGVGFFLKYAFDNDLISYLWRVIIGVGSGLAMIVGGEILSKKEKYQVWAKRVVAGGFAITYFSVYSAYHFDSYREAIGISLSLDLILLSIVVAGGIFLGLRDDSKTFAGAAFSLGFVTAYLSNDIENLTLIYGLLLTISLVVVSIYKQWSFLGIGGLIATYGLFFTWAVGYSVPEFLPSSIFLLSYYLAYTVQSLMNRENERLAVWMSVLNSLVYFGFYYFIVEYYYGDFTGLFTWIMAVVSFVLYLVAKKMQHENLRFAYLGLAIFFVTVAIPIELKEQWITIAWALEALILGIVGINLDVKLLRMGSYVVMLLAAGKGFFIDSIELSSWSRMTAMLSSAAVAYALGIYLEKRAQSLDLSTSERPANIYYDFSATALLAMLIVQEFEDFWISAAWAVLALLVTGAGFSLKAKGLRLVGIILFALTILKVFLYDSQELSTLYRTVSFIVLGVILLLVSFGYNKYKDRLKEIL